MVAKLLRMYAPLGEVRKTAGKMLSSWKEIGSGDSINPMEDMLFMGLISHWAIINLDNRYLSFQLVTGKLRTMCVR